MIWFRRSTRIPAGAMVLVWLAACAFAEGPSPEFDEKVLGEIARLDAAAEALAATDLHDQLKEGLKANRETLAKLRDVKRSRRISTSGVALEKGSTSPGPSSRIGERSRPTSGG